MSIFSGARHRSSEDFALYGIGGPDSNRIIRELDEAIHYVEPDQTPYYTLLTAMAAKETRNVKFEWMEKDYVKRRCDITTGGTWNGGSPATVSVVVAAADLPLFQIYSMVWFPLTGTLGHVIDVNASTNTLTLQGINALSSTIVSTASNAESVCELVGTSFPESSGRGEMVSNDVDFKYNYAGIAKTEITLSGTAAASLYYGGDEWEIQVAEAMVLHKKDLEGRHLFGVRNTFIDTTSARRRRVWVSDGLTAVTANEGNVLTYASLAAWKYRSGAVNWIDMSKTIFRYGSKMKIGLCGQEILAHVSKQSFLDDMATSNVIGDTVTNVLGFDVRVLKGPFGQLALVWHPRFEGKMSRGIKVYDPQFVKRREVRGRSTQLRVLPWVGEDTVDAQIMTDDGSQIMVGQTHSEVSFTAL